MKISEFFLHFFCKIFGQFNKTSYLCNRKSETTTAKIAQLVEHDLAKVGVAGSSPVFRSKQKQRFLIKTQECLGGGIGRRATLRG